MFLHLYREDDKIRSHSVLENESSFHQNNENSGDGSIMTTSSDKEAKIHFRSRSCC